MTTAELLKRREAQLPIVLGLAALLLVLGHVLLVGTEPQPDEGAAAHLFQLLMLLQFGAMVFFGLKWLPREPRPALQVLSLQAFAAAAAFYPVFHYDF